MSRERSGENAPYFAIRSHPFRVNRFIFQISRETKYRQPFIHIMSYFRRKTLLKPFKCRHIGDKKIHSKKAWSTLQEQKKPLCR